MTSVAYSVRVLDTHAHLFAVTLSITQPEPHQTVSLPVWIAGSYLVREFSKNLQRLQAQQNESPVPVRQLDKCTWHIDCQAGAALHLSYEVYAFDNSVRTAWLDSQRGFFNGTSLFLRVHGQEALTHSLNLLPDGAPADWQVATALEAQSLQPNGFGSYQASDYDALVDAPVEMGNFWRGSFTVQGVPHQFVVAGAAPSFDGPRLLADTQAICQAELDFWHPPLPHNRYVFMLNAVDSSYGGLEHRHSTALICKRADLPRLGQAQSLTATDGYTSLLGLISHEYFHTWNVKRLRPAEFASYDYSRENYTELLWFFEGFTSYFDDLLLRRAGLIDDATYLKLLGKTINLVQQTPGRHVQTVAQASFDAWVKYYRQDENTANATISYYTKGALVALCLDLTLRQTSATHLDAVMRALWQRCQAGPMTQDDLLAVLADLAGRSFAEHIAAWVHSTTELPVQSLLAQQGVACTEDTAPWSDRLGLRVTESGGSIHIKSVLRGSAAEQAGFAAGDEWLGVSLSPATAAGGGWRLRQLDELALFLGSAQQCSALIARDRQMLHLTLRIPEPATLIKLSVQDTDRVTQWLCNT